MKLETSKPSMKVYDLSEENELDTYMSREFLVPEGDEAKSLTQEELGQGQEDHCWFNHGSPYTKSFFPKYIERDVWFLDQAIWREEHKSKNDFEKTVEECEDPECRDHIVILYKGLSNQRTTWSWKKESTIETNKDKYSIVISWYCFVMHLFVFSLCMIECLHWWQYTTNMHVMGN